MNAINPSPRSIDDLAQKASVKAGAAIDGARRAADSALDSLQAQANRLVDAAPSKISLAAEKVDSIARRGMDRAKSASDAARAQASRAGDRTVTYIQGDPVKSVLIAAAAGAAIAALIGYFSRSKTLVRSVDADRGCGC